MAVLPQQIEGLGLWESSGELSLHSAKFISHSVTCSVQNVVSTKVTSPFFWSQIKLSALSRIQSLNVLSTVQSLTTATKSC